MITAIKLIITLVVMLLLCYPFIPMKGKMSKLSVASSLRYHAPDNRKNIFFLLLNLIEFVAVVLVFKLLDGLASLIYAIPFLGKLISKAVTSLSSQTDYVLFAIKLFLVNLIIVYAFIILKSLLKRLVNRIFDIESPPGLFSRKKKKKKKDKKKDQAKEIETENDTESEDDRRKNRRVPTFTHTEPEEGENENKDEGAEENLKEENKPEKRHYGKLMSAFLSIFFEGKEFEYARAWVIRVRMVLRFFVRLLWVLYVPFFLTILLSVFFPLPKGVYDVLINVLRFRDWYVYPLISIIFLTELCNIFDTEAKPAELEEDKKKEEEEDEDKKREAKIAALLAELKKRFDEDHKLRYYPEVPPSDIPEYEATSITYASSLEYIRKIMESQSGHVVESYMECLDAIYHDSNVYFPASFYSELGEYLIAYSYIRLLSGERQIFIVSDESQKETLRAYISDRLMHLTGSSATASWRIYTVEERLDQADILIAAPNDFINNNIVEQYPVFFEEVSNAIFIDADRLVTLDSYLCPVVAMKLQKVTENRIRFVFLSLNLIKGFAAGSLPKFFCVDKVLSFSSAKENEMVSYVLWNKESKSRRIYNKNIQKGASLESIIADLACRYEMDGVRLITESALEHAERKVLAMHNVEINNLYKNVVDVNYMIYSDDRCNLSAALYACTRFRGRKKSIVHILSKPYLLREYFMSKAMSEDHIVRSSFIQPRVTEHAERHKISLVRIFCDAAMEEGIPVIEFETRLKEAIRSAIERRDVISSAFCRELLKKHGYRIDGENKIVHPEYDEFKLPELAAYIVAGLYDNDSEYEDKATEEALAAKSIACKAKDFYIIIDPLHFDKLGPLRDKNIHFNRSKEVFDKLFECNRKVELRLNDEVIGKLDTFPSRVHLEYIEGQSLLYNNTEYEIDRISDDGRIVYLRRENINIKNCLDTILLRNYKFNSLKPIEDSAVLNNSKTNLEEIRVTRCNADFIGNTYGFYSLTADKQTLDFYKGVEGNPCVDTPHVRHFKNSGTVHVELKARIECNDGMRLLMAAVFNEFIRTIFPSSYHCISICPVLSEPLGDEKQYKDGEPQKRIKALYPYIKDSGAEFIENDPYRMQFIFVNDSSEDVGILDWFYDHSARYMQEFLANIYSYLYWLKACPEKQHYIYFGGEKLCECFDLDGCCELLHDYNLILSDEGETDIHTAGGDVEEEIMHRCSFCHRQMESGRYFMFDNYRYICASCFDCVDTQERLDDIYKEVRAYLEKTYPEQTFEYAEVKFDGVYDLPKDTPPLSEYYYRVDYASGTIYVERDEPATNIAVSILRGIISLWQYKNSCSNQYSNGQLYFEELKYLREEKSELESVKWIEENLPFDVTFVIGEIKDYIGVSDNGDEESDKENPEKPDSDIARTSFSFMREKAKEIHDNEEYETEEPIDDEYSNALYNPNMVPRFWKRYLRGEHIDDGKEENKPEDDGENSPEPENGVKSSGSMPICNSPADDFDSDDGADLDLVSDDDSMDEKKRLKEEKKRLKEERKRKKHEEWLKKVGNVIDEDEKDKNLGMDASADDDNDGESEDDKNTKKRSLFAKKKKPKKDENPDQTIEADDESDTDDGLDDEGTEKKTPKKRKPSGKLSPGEKILPHEKDEKTNPKIRLYNDLVRAAYNYSEEPIDRTGLSDKDIEIIFNYVNCDYPELFWLRGYTYTSQTVAHNFRCKDANGVLDVKQINKKRAEIRKAAAQFTKGISKKTDPYKALLTIYRRLILKLDYDTVGLNSGVGKDLREDDKLRSLHNALTGKKVVCAGYAVAMQYLLQSVGIVCAYVISEPSADGTLHAFNILKLGKYCYYLDATWGDHSDTTHAKNKEEVAYDYCCVPYEEFLATSASSRGNHIPSKKYYPDFEDFHYTNHEYFRYHKAYLSSYNEEELVRIFADAALRYDAKEMGDFSVDIRFANKSLAEYVVKKISIYSIIEKAKVVVASKNKKAVNLFDGGGRYYLPGEPGVVKFLFANDGKKKKEKQK